MKLIMIVMERSTKISLEFGMPIRTAMALVIRRI